MIATLATKQNFFKKNSASQLVQILLLVGQSKLASTHQRFFGKSG
jgi:hypothetical protein